MEEETQKSNQKVPREKSVRYPYFALNECINLASVIGQIGGRREAPVESVLSQLGLSSANNKRYKYHISAAEQFGLIEKSGLGFKTTDVAQNILFPTEGEEERRKNIQISFQNPPLYQKLIEQYDGCVLPDAEQLENVIYKLGVAQNKKKKAVETFIQSAQFARVLNDERRLLVGTSEDGETHDVDEGAPDPQDDIHEVKEDDAKLKTSYHKFEILTSAGKVYIHLPEGCTKADIDKIYKLLEIAI